MSNKKGLRVVVAAFIFLAFILGMFLAAMMFAEELLEFKVGIYERLPWREEHLRAQSSVKDFSTYPVMEHGKDSWYNETELIMHACGGIDGLSYTNSREAMESALENGCRVIEVDFSFTSDDVPVCVHYWEDIGPGIMDYESFMSYKIYGKYSPMDAEDIFEYMELYPDLYIVLDTKESLVELVAALKDFDAAPELMNRLIVQLYAAGEKEKVLGIYPFPEENFLFTAYMFGNLPNDIMSLCYEENVSVITLPYEWYSEDWHYFCEKDFVMFAHTVNRPDEMLTLLNNGIHGLYTDFLSEDDLDFLTE